MTEWLWSGIGLVSSLLLVWLTLQLVQRAGLIAHPNQRSSHKAPTPTGGGLGIMVLILSYLGVVVAPEASIGSYWLVAIGGLAVIGLWDDFADIKARFRLPVQLGAVGLMIWSLLSLAGGWPDAALMQIWWVLAALGLLWFVNLYNFMDGIDGIAAMQCFTFCLAVQIISGGVPGWAGALIWLLAGSSLGFLCFNWPPARIFMGDVGSQGLGLLLGGLVLLLEGMHSVSIPASVILLSVFWFDASYTLAVRLFTGQPIAQAHRSHLYQRLAQRYGHLFTTLSFLVFMSVWLLPLAWYASHLHNAGLFWAPWMLVALAVVPLGVLCQRFAAGRVIEYKQDVS